MRGVFLPILAVALAASGATAGEDAFKRLRPDQLVWKGDPANLGVKQAIVAGDPDGTGVYVIRVRFPPHVMDRPHFHPNARYVTVLEGTWCTGTGDRFDLKSVVKLPAGGFMYHPARGLHWDGACGDGPVVVQITGIGPATTTQVDPKQPMWMKVGR